MSYGSDQLCYNWNLEHARLLNSTKVLKKIKDLSFVKFLDKLLNIYEYFRSNNTSVQISREGYILAFQHTLM
jgi:galactose-1-phosphate uridylyltransferase